MLGVADMLVVEFKQYKGQSRWRRSVLNRKLHEEQGSRPRWFGGIRKLVNEDEIKRWNNFLTSK